MRHRAIHWTGLLMSLSLIAVPAAADPVDLSDWKIDGDGNWTLQDEVEENDSIVQSLNSRPTVFFNDMDSQGLALSGSIEVQTTSDDDFVGFVLGYDEGDIDGANATTDYILVDWKQGTQSDWVEGMSISRVTGGIDTSGTNTNSDAWLHIGNVNFIERAATLGTTGWADNTQYLFDIIFTATNIQVFVDSVLQFDINGTFENGSFGFYNFSQPNVRYAGITEAVVPDPDPQPDPDPVAVPEPGTLGLFGAGLLGLAVLRRRRV